VVAFVTHVLNSLPSGCTVKINKRTNRGEMGAQIEALESRTFLAGVSPSSIAGWVFYGSVIEGTSPFADSGTFEFRPNVSRNTYLIIGTSSEVSSSSGTYAYEKTGSSTGDCDAN